VPASENRLVGRRMIVSRWLVNRCRAEPGAHTDHGPSLESLAPGDAGKRNRRDCVGQLGTAPGFLHGEGTAGSVRSLVTRRVTPALSRGIPPCQSTGGD
jgi:hypothetical protein